MPSTNEAAQQAGAEQERQRPGLFQTLVRAWIIYTIFSSLFGKKTVAPAKDPSTGKVIPPFLNHFAPDESFELSIYATENPHKVSMEYLDRNGTILWREKLQYSFDDSNYLQKNVSLPMTDHLLRNGTVYAHIIAIPGENDLDRAVHVVHPLVKYYPRPKVNKNMNLLSGEHEDTEAVARELREEKEVKDNTGNEAKADDVQEKPREIVSFWVPSLFVNFLVDHSAIDLQQVPPPMSPHLVLHREEKRYSPVFYANEFWLLRNNLILVNDTLPAVNVTIDIAPIGQQKMFFQWQMDQSFNIHQSLGTMEESEPDEMKRIFLEGNPILLAVTFVVSLFHSLFDFLAFKNDISFWKNQKSMEGLSVRSIFLNCFFQFVIFLYLLDNDTSWMIIISSGVGLLIEIWKITRATNFSMEWNGVIPKIRIEDKASYQSETKKYDDMAMKTLGYVMYPLVIGYAGYSLIYETHKSWYSWVLSSMVNAVYTFGFIMMTPQLFINYKLKSVAHLPWKTFVYKALNTFIDDLFAFVIKMPTAHRLACFRDDIIFLIFLYQRWIYPVDKTRANEFGQVAEPETSADKESKDGEIKKEDGEAEAIDKGKRAEKKSNDSENGAARLRRGEKVDGAKEDKAEKDEAKKEK